MNARPAVVWHDVECGAYAADLPLWRELARAAAGPVLEIGAGTGRVALRPARAGFAVTALDRDGELLAELAGRAALRGIPSAAARAASTASSSPSRSSAVTAGPRGEPQRDTPGARADVEHRPVRRGRELAPQRQVGGVGAALDVVPDHGGVAAAHRQYSFAWPGGRAARAARAARCRWAARTRAARPSASAASSRPQALEDPQPLRRRPRVLHPQRQLGRARARAGHRRTCGGEHLPVGVPDPGDVAAVGGAVVEHAEDVELAALERERPQDLVGARGVLDQQDRGRAAAELDRLRAPERRRDGRQAGGDVGERHVQRQAQRGGRRARCRRCRARGAAARRGARRRREREGGAADPAQLDVARARPRARALAAAVGAVVAAEVGEVDGLVDVGVPAAAAVLGVRGVLELGQRERVVLDAEVQRARGRRPRSATSGSSALSTSAARPARRRRARPSGRRSCPARRSGRAGRGTGWRAAARAARAPRRRGRARTRRPRTGPRSPSTRARRGARPRPARSRRRRPCCPGAVVDEPGAGALEHRGDHRRGGRLAVGGRDHHAAARQAAGEPLDRVRLHAREHLAGQRRAAAAAGARAPGRRRRGRRPAGREARRSASRREHAQRARADADGGRQLGDRVAVGVGGERPVGRRR